ncbi:MAG: hypothetical protein JO261_03485 [Alphaproteobacteria bacterium]|nr:hypothetical protein [Alphaproteobacteria bacterium]MBV9692741.1 hypothetical protein [Alphaproteobacteria bacterium]
MSVAGTTYVERPSRIEWSAVFAGALVAAGISFTLLAFGAGIGLSVTSTAPTWRDSSTWLWLLSGLYLVFVALCAFGFGGYVAGRMHQPLTVAPNDEAVTRDGMHGIVTWGLAILMSALIAIGTAATLTPAMAPGGGHAGPSTSVAGENIIASELDELFRSDRRAVNADDRLYRRAEAARILLKSSSHNGVPAEDRDYLSAMVSAETGIRPADADARVDREIAQSKTEIRRAREAAVMQAFLIAAALLVGAAVAWYSAVEGGRDRQQGTYPRWNWSPRGRIA